MVKLSPYDSLTSLPGVGKQIAQDYQDLGIFTPADGLVALDGQQRR